MLAARIDRGARHPDAVDFDPADPRNLVYARPPEHGKVFVSSKMKGDALKAERRAAIEAIQEFPLADPGRGRTAPRRAHTAQSASASPRRALPTVLY